ncbi:MAG: hypothetical protein ACR2JG_03495 [Geodermatophilaceae bacterium]
MTPPVDARAVQPNRAFGLLAIDADCLFYGGVRKWGSRATAQAMCVLGLVASLAVPLWTPAPPPPARAEASSSSRSEDLGTWPSTEEIVGADSADIQPPVNIDAASAYAASVAAAGRGMAGVAVLDRRTGSYVDNGVGGHTAMGSASVIKVLMAEEILHRAAVGQVLLAPTDYTRIEAMLVDSNDPAASSLYTQFGGVTLIVAALTRHHLTESAAPADPQYWGNTKITAYDVVKFYDSVLDGSLPATSRDYLFGLLRRPAPIASDGFGQLFGLAGRDPTLNAAVKQGWMCCLDGVRNVHSTAVLGEHNRYVVVILTQYPPSLPWEHGLTTTTEIARLVLDGLPADRELPRSWHHG